MSNAFADCKTVSRLHSMVYGDGGLVIVKWGRGMAGMYAVNGETSLLKYLLCTKIN